MKDYTITEAFGTPEEVAELADSAITYAMATGSRGCTYVNSEQDENGRMQTTASVTVKRINS